MLTPNDIRNPKRKSGFGHVLYAPGHSHVNKPFQSSAGRHDAPNQKRWYGPRRATALEAAQDYCDYVNGQGVAAPVSLKTAGHVYDIDKHSKDPEEEAALGVLRDKRAQRQGKQGYVYLITEKLSGGALRYAKVGYSVNPKKRIAELQTGNPRPLVLLYAMPGTEEDERQLHAKYANANVLQEWFYITPELILEFPIDTQVNVVGSCPSWAQKEVPTTP